MKKFGLLLLLVSLFACEKDLMEADALGANAGIVGTWVEEGYKEDVLILDRVTDLDPARYGFTIHGDGTFIEHKNAGWCGTPPIAYDQFEGTWTAVSDSLLSIEVGYWGGIITYQMRIVSLDFEKLAIRYFYAEDRVNSR